MASPIPTQLSPGVKVSEIDLSTFVQPEAFNTAGMAGVFNWGPGLVATSISSESELAAIFGKPTLDQSDQTNNIDFLAASNFLRYSSNLKVVRIMQSGDYNSISQDAGVTGINNADYKTIKSLDEFRAFGGFSGSAGIETKSFFKARCPGNFGDSLAVIVFDGVTGQEVEVTTADGSNYSDYTLSGGYANTATLSGICGGTASIQVGAAWVQKIEVLDDLDQPFVPPQFVYRERAISEANSGFTAQQVNWKMVTFDIPSRFDSVTAFKNDFIQNGKFLYASGTTTENRSLTENGSNPNGNNGNVIPLRLFPAASRGREVNPFNEYGISNPEYIQDFIRVNPTDPRKVDFFFPEWDGTNFFTNFRPGQTGAFGALGTKLIFTLVPQTVTGIPTHFNNSILNVQTNRSDLNNDFNFVTELEREDLAGSLSSNRMWKYIYNWSGVNSIMTGGAGNGLGWCNLIGITGTQILRSLDADDTLTTTSINFDSTGGMTGIRRNFANGIVQLGDGSGTAYTTTVIEESYTSTRIFDKMPNTSEYAASVGGSNDEVSIAVIDYGGKFGPKGAILEKFELLSKAVDAKNLNGENIFYKDYINNNSQYVYLTKSFGYTGGGSLDSPATTSFGDIYSQYNLGGITYNRTGYYDTLLAYGESGTTLTVGEQILAYSIFSDDASAVDIVFVPESSVSSDTSSDFTDIESAIYDAVIEPRKDTLLIIPTPIPSSSTQHTAQAASNAINFRKNLLTVPANSYTMLVAGRKVFFDTFNNQTRKMSLASDIAGILSAQEIPWESPAGFARGNLRNVIKLETVFSKTDRDELYKNQINFFTQFNDGSGTILFGDKTLLVKPSAFDRINVRRVFIAAEKAIAKAAKYSLFEFNDEFTRSQFRNLVNPFLANLISQRGIADFKVVCDTTNNTGQVIDNNQFVADIYIKPLKSINFIQLNFIATRSDFNLTTIE